MPAHRGSKKQRLQHTTMRQVEERQTNEGEVEVVKNVGVGNSTEAHKINTDKQTEEETQVKPK